MMRSLECEVLDVLCAEADGDVPDPARALERCALRTRRLSMP